MKKRNFSPNASRSSYAVRRYMKMLIPRFLPLVVAFIAFSIGVVSVQQSNIKKAMEDIEPTSIEPPSPLVPPPSYSVDMPADNCSEWDGDEDIPLRPLIQKWLRGEPINDVPYCSKTAIEATSYNFSNVHPQLIDLNDDGVDELAIRYLCSPTGNCSMKIYQRVEKSSREIFSDRQAVSYFEKIDGSHSGFSDLQTRSHGSCCDGGQVLYRFNGRAYKPVSCAEYSYWDGPNTGQVNENPIITKRRCSQGLNPVR